MTKRREQAVVPGVDEPTRARLAHALDKPGVVAAALIGSQASGKAGPLSDVDVAVGIAPDLEPRERHERHLKLLRAASEAVGTCWITSTPHRCEPRSPRESSAESPRRFGRR